MADKPTPYSPGAIREALIAVREMLHGFRASETDLAEAALEPGIDPNTRANRLKCSTQLGLQADGIETALRHMIPKLTGRRWQADGDRAAARVIADLTVLIEE